MPYLDYNCLADFLKRYFNPSDDRLVGGTRQYDSGYIDIVRFFGPGAVAPKDVAIRYVPGKYELSDNRIRRFAGKIANELHRQGRIYEGPGVSRVAAVQLDTPPFSLTLQECDYTVFAGSCFALDYPDELFKEHGGTLREYYKKNYPQSGFAGFPLAACLGICGMLVVKGPSDNSYFCLLVHRSGHLASLEHSIGPSAAGSVDFTTGYTTLQELITTSLGQEIQEELHLQPDEYNIVPLAFAREVFRGELPQLFCMITTDLNIRQLSERLDSISSQREFDYYEVWLLSAVTMFHDSELMKINHEALMNCYLLEEYLLQA